MRDGGRRGRFGGMRSERERKRGEVCEVDVVECGVWGGVVSGPHVRSVVHMV